MSVSAPPPRRRFGLILLGDGVDRPKIFSRVAGNPHIRLFKPIFERERFASVLASADALVHGSDTEPFGLVALEAIASGLPLIVPNEGGSAEFAAPSHSESYNARDAKSCAAAILRLLARDSVQLRSATLDAAGSLAVCGLLLAGPGFAQSPNWLNARTIEIDMKNFAFVPATITLQRGVPYRLRFVNTAGGGHNFVAKAFFQQASIAPASRSTINKGEVDLGGGESGDVRLVVNRIGTYDVHCSHFMHSIFGMKGKIVVR